ncbi:guanylate kinase [Candidatus Profftella armatura]|uniref:Guanylate kinase n=1 Tax=Candidatus Profftella armatura TaxID=669502 RepID=S5R8F8_9PROT|nr:guanylate kinase [Candidatus Profftella armatura]AGS06865.1 guanylate kinase [Candidatus Profftella armatura]ALC95957.1 guanylate kinase [Candidatus Profftella armatura]QLK13776.1 guanylate kinase [Candidatus Profftella armatura]
MLNPIRSFKSFGNIFIISAPSGAGKSTLVNELLKKDHKIKLSISTTTRPMRPGEKNGREYYFTNIDNFKKLQKSGKFLEWAEVHGNFYGTSFFPIVREIKSNVDILLEIDFQGAKQIKKKFPNAIGIFILPPSLDSLKERLYKRGQDKYDVISRRILSANKEISYANKFDYIIINNKFSKALLQLKAIINANRCKFSYQAKNNISLFKKFNIL